MGEAVSYSARSYLLSHFLIFALCRCCLIHSMDASNKPEVGKEGENTSVQEQPTHKRVPKRCSKCGKSVLNLSRHQKDVHGMKKLKRKLGDYFLGMKKKPKKAVKFCPLSPCKGNSTDCASRFSGRVTRLRMTGQLVAKDLVCTCKVRS